MKTGTIGIVCLLMLAGPSAQRAAKSSVRNSIFTSEFSGEIMDSFCAGDVDDIGVIKRQIKTSKADCTLTCVKLGGARFVLYDAQTERTYKLDDQQKPEEFAGQKVTVIGTYDKDTKTIRVTKIGPEIVTAF
jgi:hypothetical protein